MISHVYALESALLRARKIAISGRNTAEAAAAMTGLLADEIDGVRGAGGAPCAGGMRRRRRAEYAIGDSAEAGAVRTCRCGRAEPRRGPAMHRAGAIPNLTGFIRRSGLRFVKRFHCAGRAGVGRKKLRDDGHRRNQIDHRSADPHEGAGGDLVVRARRSRRDAEPTRNSDRASGRRSRGRPRLPC